MTIAILNNEQYVSPFVKLTAGVESFFRGLKDLGLVEFRSVMTKASREILYGIFLLSTAIFSWAGISLSIFFGLREIVSPFFAALLATLPSLLIFGIVIYMFKKKSVVTEMDEQVPILEISESSEVVTQAFHQIKNVAVENLSLGSILSKRPGVTLAGAFALGFLLGRHRH